MKHIFILSMLVVVFIYSEANAKTTIEQKVESILICKSAGNIEAASAELNRVLTYSYTSYDTDKYLVHFQANDNPNRNDVNYLIKRPISISQPAISTGWGSATICVAVNSLAKQEE